MMSEWVYGYNACSEVLKHQSREVFELCVSSHLKDQANELVQLAHAQKLKVSYLAKADLEAKLKTSYHQGYALKVSAYRYASLESVLSSLSSENSELFFVLDQIQDPQNLGAILRVAKCLAARAVIIPKNESAEINPTVVKTSAGASESLSVVLVTNLARSIETLKEVPVWFYGASAGEGESYSDSVYDRHTAFVLGSEGKGLRPLVKQKCDFGVYIPHYSEFDSLNVSTAAAVLGYEFRRQNQRRTAPLQAGLK